MVLPSTPADTPILDPRQPIQPIAVSSTAATTAATTAAAPAVVVLDGGGVNLHVGNVGEVVKKKRGRPPKAQANQPAAKKSREEDEEEDVCFICFDGGSLVLCDRRGCPKAYHPSCIKRDEAFFRSKAKWNCGWHICSICEKTAHHMCYTCTHSLCKGCIRQSDYVCVRGDKGFCALCMKTIMLIENSRDATANVDFDDKTSWEYLFKVYWVYLKRKLSLTLDELTQAKNPWKLVSIEPLVSHISTTVRRSITSELSFANLEANESKRRKTEEQPSGTGLPNGPSKDEPKEWASKELLDLVAHMKNGDTSVSSLSDVQALLLEYIKINNLRDQRKKTQIICDLRLMNLFGKPRVGHIEMLKLLESQFYVKKDPEKNTTASTVKPEDTDHKTKNTVTLGNKERRNHRKGEKRITQNKLDEYAAVDVHNMNLIYLRRNLMESLVENTETFREKVVGSIVQIRISGSDQKDDMYRLVQVVGTTKVDVPYKVGEKLVDVMLEVLNLDKKETVSIDTISNQDLSEDECRRLRESIRCRLVRCFTVGEIQEKAMALQSMLLDDRIKTEMQRLNQLRDQASEKGQKKSVRECAQKLKILKTPEERERRLREIPVIHSDPKMNPDYESDDTEEYFNNEHGEHLKLKFPWVSGTNTISPTTKADNLTDQPGHSGVANVVDANVVNANVVEESSKPNTGQDAIGLSGTGAPQNESELSTERNCNPEAAASSPPSKVASELKPDRSVDDGIWHYRDPSGNVQGPFSMVQLQKWSTSGYFPADMRVWVDREADSVLLNDVLHEQFNSFDVWGPEKVDCNSKDDKQVESVIVSTTIPATSYALDKSVNLERLPDDLNSEPATVASLTESTEQFGVKYMPDINQHVSSVFDFGDTLQKTESCEEPKIEISRNEEHSKLLVQDPGIHESRENPKIETSRDEEHSKLLVQDPGIHNMPDINQHVPSVLTFTDTSVVDLPNPLLRKESRKNPKTRSSRNKEHSKRLVQNSVINDMPDTTKIQDSRNKEHSKLLVQDSVSQNIPGAKQHVSSVFDFEDSSLVDLPGRLPKKESYKIPKTESSRTKEHSKLSVQDLGIRSMPDSSQRASTVFSFADASPVDLLGPLQNKESHETQKIQDSGNKEHSKLSLQESGSRSMPDSSQHASSVFNFADASLVDLPSPLSKKESQKTPKTQSSRNKEHLHLSVQDSGIRNMPDSTRHASSVFSFADASLVDLPSPLPEKESPKVQRSRNKEHSKLSAKDLGIHNIPDSSQHASSVFSFADASLVNLPSPLQKKKSRENLKIQDSRSNEHLKRLVQDSGIHNTAGAIQHAPVFTFADSSPVDAPSPLQKKKSHENPKVKDSRNTEHSKLLVQDSRIHNMPDSSQHASSVFSFADASRVDLPSPLQKKKSRETLKVRDSRDKDHSKLPVQDSRIHNTSDTKQHVPSVFNFTDASLVDLPSPLPKKESHKNPKLKSSKNKEHSKLPVQDSGIHNTSDTKQHAPSVFNFTDASLMDLPSPLPKKESHKNPKVQSSENKEHSKLLVQDSGIHNMSDTKQHVPSVFEFTDASLVDLPSPLPKKESHKNPKVQNSKDKEHSKLLVQDSGIQNTLGSNQHVSSLFGFADASLLDLPSPLPKKESPKIQNFRQHVPSVFSFADASLVDLPSPLQKKKTHENHSRDGERSNFFQDSVVQNMPDINQHVSSVFTVADAAHVDLAGPLQKRESHENPKIEHSGNREQLKPLVQDSGNPPNWSTTLSLVIGGTQLPETGDEWGRYPPAVDHQAATTSSTIDQMTHLPSWHGLGETIEFSTLAEESVSDLLAEVDAMESRNGVPSPTSRRNSFLEDLFNGSIDDFSPTTDQGTRSDGFSSTADIHLNRQPTGFQFSFGLETKPVCAVSIPQTSVSDNIGFKWADMGASELHPPRQDLIDLNDSTRAETDEGEREPVFEKKSTTDPLVMAGGSRAGRESKEREGESIKADIPASKTVHGFPEVEEEEGEFIQPDVAPPLPPPPLPPLLPTPPQPPTMGYERSGRPSQGTSGRVHSHTSGSSRSGNAGWDSHHRRSGGDRDRDRYNNISNSISPRDRSHHTEDSGYGRSSKASWGRQSSFGSGSGSGSGGYSRPSKGRVCKFYESGRCRKGSACTYLHPQNR